jgi:hypothetical protein
LRDKIDEMVKSKKLLKKTLETKTMMMEMRSQDKKAKWELLREDENHKAVVEDRRASGDEKRAIAELLAEENKIIMTDPSNMDVYTREWWYHTRVEILRRRRAAASANGASGVPVSATGGGGDDAE